MLQALKDEGELSGQSLDVLTAVDLGATIQAALGTPALDVKSSSTVLLNILIDDSTSIRMCGNSQILRDCTNNLGLDAVQKAKARDEILVFMRTLNGLLICEYVPIEQAPRLDTHNYNPSGGTPLYDESIVFYATVLAKTKELRDYGITVRSVNLTVSDGHDEGSRRSASDVRPIVRDMLATEQNIIAGLGIDDIPKKCERCATNLVGSPIGVTNCPNCGQPFSRTNFNEVFAEMGLDENWILTPGNTEKEIRQAFQLFSSSASSASKNAASFSKVAGGGFANP